MPTRVVEADLRLHYGEFCFVPGAAAHAVETAAATRAAASKFRRVTSIADLAFSVDVSNERAHRLAFRPLASLFSFRTS